MVRRGGRPDPGPVHPSARRNHSDRGHRPSGGALLPGDAVELPAGHGDPQARPGASGRVHRRPEAGGADPADIAAVRRAAGGGGAAAGRRERRDHDPTRGGFRGATGGPAAAQAQLHGLDGGGAHAPGTGRTPGAAHVDGAGWQRPVRCVRRRRSGRRRGGCHAGQVSQRRAGLHRREPVPGAGRRGGALHRQDRATGGGTAARPGRRSGNRRRPARRRPRGAEDRRARAACRRAGRAGPRGRAPGRRTRSLLRADRARRRRAGRRRPRREGLRAGRGADLVHRRTPRRRAGQTRRSTAWRATSTPATCPGRTA